jgi:hypothetical protein
MTSKLFASALCLILSPLLVAQQVAAQSPNAADTNAAPARLRVTLPENAYVRWISPDRTSLAEVKAGDVAQFAVDRDVITAGTTVIHAGVPVVGVVASVTHSSRFRHRDGQILVRITETAGGRATEVLVQCPNPADSNQAATYAPAPAGLSTDWFLKSFLVALAVVFVLLLLAFA